jgi:hypothetical protein
MPTERLIQSQVGIDLVRLVSEFKKRGVERKGGKKQENLSKKLIEENLEDLRDMSGEEK